MVVRLTQRHAVHAVTNAFSVYRLAVIHPLQELSMAGDWLIADVLCAILAVHMRGRHDTLRASTCQEPLVSH
jgi:hypothetical protein